MTDWFNVLIDDVVKHHEKKEPMFIFVDGDSNEARSTACLSIIEKTHERLKIIPEINDIIAFTPVEAFNLLKKDSNDEKVISRVMIMINLYNFEGKMRGLLQKFVKQVQLNKDFSVICLISSQDRSDINNIYFNSADYLIWLKGLERDKVTGTLRTRYRNEHDTTFLNPEHLQEFKNNIGDNKHLKKILDKNGAIIYYPLPCSDIRKEYDVLEKDYLKKSLEKILMSSAFITSINVSDIPGNEDKTENEDNDKFFKIVM